MSRGCVSSLPACAVLLIVSSIAAGAQDGQRDGRLFEAALPGGIRGALAALDDRVAPDRSQFLPELIRRFHSSPILHERDPRVRALQPWLARLEAPRATAGATEPGVTTVPLPLPPRVWIDAVFRGHASRETLVAAILRSRSASLLYYGLLSLDDGTREWLASRPDLVAYLSGRAAAFLVAAPGFRVRDGRLQPPGGQGAAPIWQALVGHAADPDAFLRAILESRRGRLAYFVGSLGQLTGAQVTVALRLDSPEPDERVAAASSVFHAFEKAAGNWVIDRHPFLRPTFDPALLLSELSEDERGRPIVTGSRRFWSEVFGDPSRGAKTVHVPANASEDDEPVRFDTLCEHLFTGSPAEYRRRYNIVLFASRIIGGAARAERDAVDAVRAAGEYRALVATLERAGVTDVAVLAAAARRAATLTAIRDRTRAIRALSQFQGALALIARAGMRGGIPAGSVSRLVASLCAVDLTDRGEYDGRLVRWIDGHLTIRPEDATPIASASAHDGNLPATLEHQLLRRLAGSIPSDPPFVDWEGTRYRVDLPLAEEIRLTRLLGSTPPPFFTAARTLVEVADIYDASDASAAQRRAAADAFATFGQALEAELQDDDRDRYRQVARAVQHVSRASNRREDGHAASAVRELADRVLARGLVDLAYVVAFGQPGTAAISATAAARRHDFGLGGSRRNRAWELPLSQSAAGARDDWHVTGAILGLDVKLAQLSLMRISSRPPARPPSLAGSDRTVFVEAVRLAEPAAMTGPPDDAAAAALRRGRARLAAVRSPSDIVALADEIRLGPARRALLAWAAVHEPERVTAHFSLSEVLWLGAPNIPRGRFDPWGAPAEPRQGCLCLRQIDRGRWDVFIGRWHAGILASVFPDLNLRLAELLGELHMPALLLPAILPAATADLVERAELRDYDDRRGLVEFVRALHRERVEEYLALLTTDGPLLPVGIAADPAPKARNTR